MPTQTSAVTSKDGRMKTYQIVETIFREFFIEAKTKEEALQKLAVEDIECNDEWSSEQLKVVDIHDGDTWDLEPCVI